jgi:hypothetical protein
MADPTQPISLPVAIVQLVGQLAWPATLLFIVWRFRQSIESLISRVASLKVGGSEWVFQGSAPKPPTAAAKIAPSPLTVGPDGFVTAEGLRDHVAQSGLLEREDKIQKELLIFQTPTQRTWLLASEDYLYVLLDDEGTRKRANLIQTLFEKRKTLPLAFDAQAGAGIVRFKAEETWWYYSLHLFPTTSRLQDAVERLVL